MTPSESTQRIISTRRNANSIYEILIKIYDYFFVRNGYVRWLLMRTDNLLWFWSRHICKVAVNEVDQCVCTVYV